MKLNNLQVYRALRFGRRVRVIFQDNKTADLAQVKYDDYLEKTYFIAKLGHKYDLKDLKCVFINGKWLKTEITEKELFQDLFDRAQVEKPIYVCSDGGFLATVEEIVYDEAIDSYILMTVSDGKILLREAVNKIYFRGRGFGEKVWNEERSLYRG